MNLKPKSMKNIKNKKAFSLVELSIVLLIIGIIIAGISESSRLIAQFRLSSARSQTESSPVNSVKGLVQWYEATSEASFEESETEDHDLVLAAPGISIWYDINQTDGTRKNATQGTDSQQPLYYANCIQGLPCVRFDGTNDNLAFDGTGIVGSNYTIFLVVQRREAVSSGLFNPILGSSTALLVNTALSIGHDGDTKLLISQGDTGDGFTVPIDGFVTIKPELHTIINSATTTADNIEHFLNGSMSISTLTTVGDDTLGALSSYANGRIGQHNTDRFAGDIGEIIIYNRALKAEERRSVNDYLAKKWSIR